MALISRTDIRLENLN